MKFAFGVMATIPNKTGQFTDRNYWDAFFKKRRDAFEWYGSYGDLSSMFERYLEPSDSILQIGCGNSTLADSLYDNGFQKIVSIDTAADAIHKQISRNANKRPALAFQIMDTTQLSYEDEHFEAVIDKGTLDALLPDEEGMSEYSSVAFKMIHEIQRVLSPAGGRYLVVTLAQKHVLQFWLHCFENRSMQDQCQTFQQSAAQYREQYEQLKQEYQYMQDELRRQQLSLQSKLQEKDAEIARLMSQSASRTVNGRSSPELEQRVKHLTENLIQKQTLIEALQTEKSALALQMERLERMYREAESAAVRTSATVINVATEETSNVSNRVPHFMRESPFDSGMAKGVKRAYGTLDTLSIKVGVFLRRYPMARVIIFLYIVLLHCWVMVVLLTYTPEIHPPGYGEPSGPAAAGKLPNK